MQDQLSQRRSRHAQALSLLLVLAVGALLAACGASSSTASNPTGSATPSTSATAGGSPTSSATPNPNPSNPTQNTVWITTSKSAYQSDETIIVTIHNGLSVAISVTNRHTNCTLVDIERLTSSGWQIVDPCRTTALPRQIQLPAGSALPQNVTPTGGTTAAASVAPAWPSGSYRVRLSYTPQGASQQSSASAAVAYSSTFTIAG